MRLIDGKEGGRAMQKRHCGGLIVSTTGIVKLIFLCVTGLGSWTKILDYRRTLHLFKGLLTSLCEALFAFARVTLTQ